MINRPDARRSSAETVFDGYKLVQNSPAINAGKIIVDNNGYKVEKDFFGNKVSGIPDIGAHETEQLA